MVKITRSLLEGGIYVKVNQISKAYYYLKRFMNTKIQMKENKVDRVSPLSINSSIQTVFFIYLILVSVALISVLVEIVIGNLYFIYIKILKFIWFVRKFEHHLGIS